jgi:AcrR family transcriptional regulator
MDWPMDKRTQIIFAAMDLLVKNDIQATPMTAIARAAETGMGAIYNYFKSKEELINAIFVFICFEQRDHFKNASGPGGFKERFERDYNSFCSFYIDQPVYFSFLNQFAHSPLLSSDTLQELELLNDPLKKLLSDGKNQGLIKDLPLVQLVGFLNASGFAFIKLMLQDENPGREALRANQISLVWEAISA